MNDQPVPDAGRIQPLSPEARAQIHSSRHITTLQGVIASLLENSLDAGATKIDVAVDWTRGGCSVDDNGIGIPVVEFLEGGGLGRMYCTSKRAVQANDNDPKHGSTGTFLAELAAMSLLTVTSVHHRSTRSGVLTMHHGKVLSRHTNNADTTAFVSVHQQHGTSVSVRDLFGSMPVRVKQRTLAADPVNEDEKAWTELKCGTVGLLLAWPRPCVIRVRDVGNASRKLSLISGNSSSLTERRLGQLTGKSTRHDLRDALPVIFQASLAPAESRSKWIPLSASTPLVSLKGMICLEPAPTRQCQFIAIGIMPCATGDSHHELYHAVHRLFANSSFGVLEDGPSRTGTARSGDGPIKQSKAQKGLDRHAMYFLQLSFRDSSQSYQVNLETTSEATTKSLVDVLEAAVQAWLESNHFRPRKRRPCRNDEHELGSAPWRELPASATATEATINGRGTISTDEDVSAMSGDLSARGSSSKQPRVFDLSTENRLIRPVTADPLLENGTWHAHSHARAGSSRARTHRTSSHGCARAIDPSRSASAHESGMKIVNCSDKAASVNPLRVAPLMIGQLNSNRHFLRQKSPARLPSSDDFGPIDDADLLGAEMVQEEETMSWVDPISKQSFRVNARTGVVLPVAESSLATSPLFSRTDRIRPLAAVDSNLSSAGNPISLSRRGNISQTRPSTAQSEREKWLPGFLEDWKNPVFAPRDEGAIPTASLGGPGLIEQIEEERRCCVDSKYHHMFSKHDRQGDGGTSLSRASLGRAEVIGQVDQKFILVKLPSTPDAQLEYESGSTLVLVDQHAASERVVLEDLLADMITAPSTSAIDQDRPIIKAISLLHGTTRSKTLAFELSSREHELFTHYQPHFQHWGITCNVPPPTFVSALDSHKRSGAQSHRLIITHLPAVIAERCSNFPALAIELLREEAWALADGTRKPVSPTVSDSQPAWLSLLPHMPAKMLAMLHSRACRSAIMFNDSLSKEECENLLRKLSKCTFPFVCAHGRVGMVPVMDLGRANDGRTGLSLEAMKLDSTHSVLGVKRAEQSYGNEWDGRENLIDATELAQFMKSWNTDEDSDPMDDEVMSEASPHKFA